jgi:hypothetical protein
LLPTLWILHLEIQQINRPLLLLFLLLLALLL